MLDIIFLYKCGTYSIIRELYQSLCNIGDGPILWLWAHSLEVHSFCHLLVNSEIKE